MNNTACLSYAAPLGRQEIAETPLSRVALWTRPSVLGILMYANCMGEGAVDMLGYRYTP